MKYRLISSLYLAFLSNFFSLNTSLINPTLCEVHENTKSVLSSLKEKGFLELGNKSFSKKDYADVYYYFDRFIDLFDEDIAFADLMNTSEKIFLSDASIKSRYCSAPPSFRDPRKNSTKRFPKIYFQFIKEHYDLLVGSGNIPNNPDIHNFFRYMQAIDSSSKEIFKSILSDLEKEMPGITALAYGKHNDLTVVTKIVRYEQAEDGTWGTTPHVDKSALTLILNSDDVNDESLWLCEDINNPSLAKLHKPERIFNKSFSCSSALLIPGIELLKVGFSLMPTVHGVRPITRPYRHAVISFLLIPDVDMSQVITDFNDELKTITVVKQDLR